ncbi:hypothetical protein [Parapedobacter sp. 10938]|uniref:hypothetical protein n=1 Tax=Parapedobacter flavus TaxID=3110225 RepID=UPI002DB842DA|nr:hypothetical protein [Parapedobacter sp. 10938]MEC3881941.1 hypothetical protein [Parapedobacter sp. 10938]
MFTSCLLPESAGAAGVNSFVFVPVHAVSGNKHRQRKGLEKPRVRHWPPLAGSVRNWPDCYRGDIPALPLGYPSFTFSLPRW